MGCASEVFEFGTVMLSAGPEGCISYSGSELEHSITGDGDGGNTIGARVSNNTIIINITNTTHIANIDDVMVVAWWWW